VFKYELLPFNNHKNIYFYILYDIIIKIFSWIITKYFQSKLRDNRRYGMEDFMYKLIALDMDGTLLREDKTISKATHRAIENARNKGVKVVLATGRPAKGIEKYLKTLDLVNDGDYAVAFNGAIVQDTKTGQVIAENLMTIEDWDFLYKLSVELNVNIHLLTHSVCITPKWNKYSQLEVDMNNIPLEVLDNSELDRSTTVVKIMFIDEPEILSAAIEKIPAEVYEKYTVLRSAPYFLEFLNKSVNKGVGVEMLAEALGLSPKEVICVGDAGNDIDMIKYAGLGVAMGNAFPEVKEIADYITSSNEEDGVANVINKFILDGELAV
jgi:Cof subfamily protein (haloacid dehalogenase superfamily)